MSFGLYATGVSCSCHLLFISEPGTVTRKSRFILPLRSAICLLRAVTVISASCTVVMSSPLMLSCSERVMILVLPLSSVHLIVCGTEAVSIRLALFYMLGLEIRTLSRGFFVPHDTMIPVSNKGMIVRFFMSDGLK